MAMSQRHGGHSRGPWASLNLGAACGDDPAAVRANRAAFARALGARPVWLRQVHGIQVLRLDDAAPAADLPAADAAWTRVPGLACTVLVADCLPVLFTARDGRAVAAAHAGWRGLAAGVLESVVETLRADAEVPARDLLAWLGPCIGPAAFEVGSDVLQAFGADPLDPAPRYFRPRPLAGQPERPSAARAPRWLADLPGLARARLVAAGLSASAISGGEGCTYSQTSDFFSFRRDGVTGRMAAAIWRKG
jgi:YfiH family protein